MKFQRILRVSGLTARTAADLAGYVRDHDPDGGERDEDSYDLDDHDLDGDELNELGRRSGSISRSWGIVDSAVEPQYVARIVRHEGPLLVRQGGSWSSPKGAGHMAEEAHRAEMGDMPPMLAYTIRSPINTGAIPYIRIGQGNTSQVVKPNQPTDNSYWIVILDANKPTTKVQEWVIPGQNNTTVPSNLDQYMHNPGYLFAVVTQTLGNWSVPQGAFYDYLAEHGAGRDLQKLEQISSHTQTGYGLYNIVSYILTGQGGPPGTLAYERAGLSDSALLLMSLMPMANGQPPYSICDSYTFIK